MIVTPASRCRLGPLWRPWRCAPSPIREVDQDLPRNAFGSNADVRVMPDDKVFALQLRRFGRSHLVHAWIWRQASSRPSLMDAPNELDRIASFQPVAIVHRAPVVVGLRDHFPV